MDFFQPGLAGIGCIGFALCMHELRHFSLSTPRLLHSCQLTKKRSEALLASQFGGNVLVYRGQGREYVFTFVKNFMASRTPSLTALPLSLMPPKGDISMR